MRGGFDVPSRDAVLLELTDGTKLDLRLERAESARVLSHLGVSPDQRTLTVPLRRSLGAFTIALLTYLVSLVVALYTSAFVVSTFGVDTVGVFGLLAPVVSTILVVRRFGFPRVEIGTDGVRVRGMWRQTFLPHHEIERVEAQGSYVVLHRKDRATIILPLVAADADETNGVVHRIEGARKTGSGTRIAAVLARAGRSVAEWRQGVLATRGASFREQALAQDDLDHIVADARATPEQRIGAAPALRASDPEAGKVRIATAAASTAEEHLRIALQTIADDAIDDAALERASSTAHTRPRVIRER